MAKKVLGSLEVVLGANTAAFTRGMRESQRDLKKTELSGLSMGRSLTSVFGRITSAAMSMRTAIIAGVAAFGTYRFAAGLNKAAQEADNLGKMSSRLGVGVEQLSALKFAADETGVQFEALTKVFARFQKSIGDSLGRGGSSISVGKTVVQLRDLRGQLKPTTQLMGEIGAALQKIGTQAQRATVAQSLFGKDGGDKFLQMVAEGGNLLDHLNKSWERASRLNLIVTPEQAKIMAAYNDSLGRVVKAYQGMRLQIITGLAPALTVLNNKIAEFIADAPRVAKAAGRAFNMAAGGDPQQRAIAAAALTEVKTSGLDLIKTLSIEAGRTLGMVFVETITLGIRVASPVIADVFRDAAGQAFNGIFGINIAPSKRGRLADLRRQLAVAESPDSLNRLAAAQRELEALNSAGPMAAMGMGMGGAFDRRGTKAAEIKQLIKDLSEAPALLRETIAQQEEIVRREDIVRAEALGEAMGDWLTVLDAAESSLTNKIVPKFQEFEKARDRLFSLFLSPKRPATRLHRAEHRPQTSWASSAAW